MVRGQGRDRSVHRVLGGGGHQQALARGHWRQDLRGAAKDDPARQTAMQASFLRASLFTSVVAFGVAALAAVLGVMLFLIGWALRSPAPVAVSPQGAPSTESRSAPV